MAKSRIGYCNICGTRAPLTEDHVPPRGAGGLSGAELTSLSSYLAVDESRPKIYQNGIKFPTLCARCNNALLGARFDRALIDVSKQVTNLVRTTSEGILAL